MTAAKKRGQHLSESDRQIIHNGIVNGLSKSEIARSIHADPTTVAKEIRLHSITLPKTLNLPMPCAVYKKCRHRSTCGSHCRDFIPFKCIRRDRTPGACNGCTERCHCRYEKREYNYLRAQADYRKTLSDSRTGVNMTTAEAREKGALIKQLLDQGQSPYEIVTNHPELKMSERTLYSYIENDVFSVVGVHSIDLRRQSGRRPMPKKKEVEYKKRKDNRYLIGRTKDDLEAFMKQQSDLGNHVSVVEMDTMYNDVSKGPFLQTFKFVDPMFAFAVFHEEKTAAAMTDGVNLLDRILGPELFDRLCTVIKPDRGSEFSDPEGIERRADGSLRTHVFYCDAMASWQKPHVENKHVEYRYILPNGADLRALGLTSQKALNLVLSHLNSRTLESIPSGKTPFMYARFFYPELVERMAAFGIEEVDSDYVLLKPQLLKDSCRIKANEKIFALIQNHSK